jgi:type IV secretion system protein VirB10
MPPAPPAPPAPSQYTVEPGTRILLNLLNSVSTRSAMPGDRVYLETAFPVLVGPRIVIPPGSYVTGTITQAKRAGKVRGKAELYVRFDSLTLPNGTTRDFRARTAALDGDQRGKLDSEEGKIKGDSDKTGDLTKVGTGAGYGAMIGGVADGIRGVGLGAAAGAAAGLVGVLVSRGPDAVLPRGSTMEMLLDRPLQFREDELPTGTSAARTVFAADPSKDPNASKKTGWPGIRRP